ncbi:MAG: hypothetical protein WBM76_03440 [Woeseiaceae bacterium]
MQNSLKQLADSAVFLDRVAQMRIGVDIVMITSAFLGALKHACLFEFADEPKSRTFGYTYSFSHIAQPRVRVVGQTNQHVGVIAEKGPGGEWL